MKKGRNLIFSFCLTIFAVSPIYAQFGGMPRNARAEDQRIRIEQQTELRRMESMRRTDIDNQKAQQEQLLSRINSDLKELTKCSAKLVKSAQESNDKEAANLAGKIVKISKRLRQELNLTEPKYKLTALPVSEDINHQEHLQQLAGAIGSVIEQLNQSQITKIVGPKTMDQASEQLTTIEIQALALRNFASNFASNKK